LWEFSPTNPDYPENFQINHHIRNQQPSPQPTPKEREPSQLRNWEPISKMKRNPYLQIKNPSDGQHAEDKLLS
jgi:hypothetical protein